MVYLAIATIYLIGALSNFREHNRVNKHTVSEICLGGLYILQFLAYSLKPYTTSFLVA